MSLGRLIYEHQPTKLRLLIGLGKCQGRYIYFHRGQGKKLASVYLVNNALNPRNFVPLACNIFPRT